MVATIVLNQSNIVNTDGYNNTLVYKFPNSVAFPNHEVAVQSVSMFYSWGNINNTSLNNYLFTYTWVVGTTSTTYNVAIPNGLYEITDINNYLQYVMIKNGTYLINASGQNVYYAEMLVNANRYAIQVNTFPVPTALPTGWSVPTGSTASGTAPFVGFPTTTFNPVLTFPANFNKIIGFTAGFATAVNTGVGTNLSYISTTAPQVQPNPNLYIAISNIANKYSSPSSILYSVAPSVAFGQQITETPPQFGWNKLLAGTYNELRVQLLGQDYQPLQVLDPNMTILLVIRDIKDGGAGELLDRLAGSK
jgi:hypothetical protein